VRVELYRPGSPDDVVAEARWNGQHVELEVRDEAARVDLDRVFRPTPVVVDDGAHRRLGTHGEIVLQPGTLEWFRAAAQARAPAAGLAARFVPNVRPGAGWDPAADYRTFTEEIEHLDSRG
jgi:hypothetical protein